MPTLDELVKKAWDDAEQKQHKKELIELEKKMESGLAKRPEDNTKKNKI